MSHNYKKASIVYFIVIILIVPTLLVTAEFEQREKPRLSNIHFNLLLESSSILQLQRTITIEYPRFTCPAILEPGDNLTLHVRTTGYNHIYDYIETANEPIIDTFWLPINHYQTIAGITHITITIPTTIPIETYNLTVFTEDYGTFFAHTQPHAITIVDSIDDTYSFVHVTDLHVGDFRGFTESIRETIGWKSIKRCINEINLLHPDFVLISGDLVFGQLYFKEYSREYRLLYDILQRFDVPIYIAPGNHDGYNRIFEDGFEYWVDYFGPLNYSFDYGTSHFQAINSYDQSKFERLTFLFIPLNWGGSISTTQLKWIEHDLEKSKNSDITFMFLHHNPLWETTHDSLLRNPYENRVPLLNLIDKKNIDMVLTGHVHSDNVTIVNDTIFISTTTPESSISNPDDYWGYRRIIIENGSIISYNYKEPKYSIPTYKLDTKQIDPYNKKIINNLDIPISAFTKFILPKGNYSAQNGLIINQRQNEIQSELYIETTVPAHNNSIVTIHPN